MWIGTASGLNRFDGYSMKVFKSDSQDSTSLPDNSILNLFELPNGKIGVMTAEGLSLYDPEYERFLSSSEFYDRYQIPAGQVRKVVVDEYGYYWFVHNSAGLIRYHPEADSILSVDRTSGAGLFSDSITDFIHHGNGEYWLVHSHGVLQKLKIKDSTYSVIFTNKYLQERNGGSAFDYRLLADSDGDLWLYSKDDNQGLYYFDVRHGTLRHISKNNNANSLNTDLVTGVVQDENGLLWVGTDHGGLNLLDKKDFSITYVLNREEDEKSVAQNSINSLYQDSDGIIWIGTFKKGVSYYHKNIFRFSIYKHSPLNPSGLPYGDVNRFVEDKDGNLWIGTNGGGLIHFDRDKNQFTRFRHDPRDPNSLSSDVIVSLCIDFMGRLWIGTYYGGLNCYDGKEFIRYYHGNGRASGGLPDQNIWEIFEDSRKRLWVGTISGGLYLFDPQQDVFTNFRRGDINSVHSNYVAALAEDRIGNLWVGTDRGIDVLNQERGRFFHFENEKGDPSTLSDNGVLDIRQDAKGRIWIGTEGGLNLFDSRNNSFKAFKESDGLPSNTILTILIDSVDHLWVSTPNGISHVTVLEGDHGVAIRCRNYSEGDGLQGRQFNENAALRTRDGDLIFGGANGFNIFRPGSLPDDHYLPPIILSGLQVYNEAVEIGEKVAGRVILPKAISTLTKITLPPGQNVFSLDFVGLDFLHPEKTQYQYQLEGFSSSWLAADGKSRRVTFTNLDPGAYVFNLRVANSDGHLSKGTSLEIVILPPFWKTDVAFILYVLLIIAALLVTRRLIQQRERIKFSLETEREEARRTHELDLMKIRFFTNVSHEFRTPLTLILTPLERILRQTWDDRNRRQFELIQRNARRLLNLVNQLLDFRKLESQEVRFNPSEGDMIHFIEETVYSFSELSENKKIWLEFHSSLKTLEATFDPDKLERILFNLLSNAFKFTASPGVVSVTVEVQQSGASDSVKIAVSDTGIGIPRDKQEKIFERFFQNSVPKSLVNQGSGIGLSITRDFVQLHGGTIEVQSAENEGSTFTVFLPLRKVASGWNYWHSEPDMALPATGHEASTLDKPLLLLIEDSEDFRAYLKENMKVTYEIVEAANGVEGLQKAISLQPDLIVSDIMMPEMNGIELCSRIKNDPRVSHVPVILLTARTAEEQKLEGFETGADDYVTKPFSFEMLMARIRNLITLRKKLHQAFPRQLEVKASELKITSLDEKFIKNAVKVVEENVSTPDFSVEQLSHEMGISRAHFYKKVVALTGKSPLEFMRTIRLQMAAQMLQESQLTVAEIAYKVGFNNPKYFTRYFKEEYKMLPSVYAQKRRKTSLISAQESKTSQRRSV